MVDGTTAMLLGMAMSLGTWVLYAVIFFSIVGPAGYYFLVVKNRRKWHANIWEQRGDNLAILTGKDTVIEKKVKKKNAHIYLLKARKYAVHPIQEEQVITYKNKNYVDYLRQGSDYIPFVQKFNFDGEAYKEFVPQPYDVTMQMISIDSMVEELFKNKMDLLQKIGPYVAIGIIVVLLIILMNQYFDFISNNMTPWIAQMQESNTVLQKIAGNMIS